MASDESITVYVCLLDEGTPTSRSTQAVDLGGGLFKLLATPNYDPEDEHWEFAPGTVVRCEVREYAGNQYLLAVA